jgi:hypothetical protein
MRPVPAMHEEMHADANAEQQQQRRCTEQWNLDALSGVFVLYMPLEEILFALAFGLYWSRVYEHFNWQTMSGTRPSVKTLPGV